MTEPIKDYDAYQHRMNKSLIDKLFFADKIPDDTSVIIDYGCADGTLLRAMRSIFPTAILIGYDIDEKMIEKSAKGENRENIVYHSNWNLLMAAVGRIRSDFFTKGLKYKSAVVASSLIHEVYSYGTPEQVTGFWNEIFNSDFDYICIRDMMVSMPVDRPSDINDVVRVLRKFHRTKPLLDFQANWGSIENNKNLVHFLLKYKYLTPNWDREVKENYIPLYREDFLALIPEAYTVTFHEHFTLPYLMENVLNDMGVVLKDPTHIKIILSRRR